MTRRPKEGQDGAGSRIRTDDLLITNQLLYQLSYAGKMRGTVAQSYPAANLRINSVYRAQVVA
jgi:hypothetical protein